MYLFHHLHIFLIIYSFVYIFIALSHSISHFTHVSLYFTKSKLYLVILKYYIYVYVFTFHFSFAWKSPNEKFIQFLSALASMPAIDRVYLPDRQLLCPHVDLSFDEQTKRPSPRMNIHCFFLTDNSLTFLFSYPIKIHFFSFVKHSIIMLLLL